METSFWIGIASKMLAALPLSSPPSADLAPALAAATAEATCDSDWGIVECTPIWPVKRRGQLLALTIAVGYFESGFIERIGAGRCRKHECDAVEMPGGRVIHLAQGYWQLHQTGIATADEWREARGSAAFPTFMQARIAIRSLAAAAGRCGRSEGEVRGAISGFATGGRCFWKGSSARERVVRSLLEKTQM